MKGVAVVADTGDASLIVEFSGETPSPSDLDEVNYTVVYTDYDTYTVVYSCSDYWYGWFSFDYLWILARESQLDEAKLNEAIAKIDEKLPNYGYFTNNTQYRHDETCTYSERPE